MQWCRPALERLHHLQALGQMQDFLHSLKQEHLYSRLPSIIMQFGERGSGNPGM